MNYENNVKLQLNEVNQVKLQMVKFSFFNGTK